MAAAAAAAAADATAAAAAVPCGSVAAGNNLDFSDVFLRITEFQAFCSVFERFWTFWHAFGCFFTVLEPSIPWSEY